MAKDRLDLIEERVRNTERRLELLDYRVRSVEAWRAGTAQPVAPPPVLTPDDSIRHEPAPMAPVQTPIQAPVAPPAVQAPRGPMQPTAKHSVDTEYMIGAQVLPKIGAGVVLLAVIYFVQLGYTKGWFTPWMIFWAAVAFCAAFVGFGQWLRNEKEQYGQILTGIGSCGLYITFAAGRFAQHLLSDQAVVTLFIALSLANLVYGLFSKSRAFLVIGIIGGFIGAGMPLAKHEYNTEFVLHLAILVPAAIIAARRRWADMAALLWLLSTLSLTPFLASNAPWQLRVALLDVSTLGAIAAYCFAWVETDFDRRASLSPAAMIAAGLIGLGIQHQHVGAVNLALFGLGGVLLALIPAGLKHARKALLLAGVATIVGIAPFCFTPVECIGAFIGASAIASAIGLLKVRESAFFAAGELALGVFSYLVVQAESTLQVGQEAWLLVGMIVASALAAYSGIRAGGKAQPLVLFTMGLLAPMVGRLGLVTLTQTVLAPDPTFAVAEALTLFALATIAVAAASRWISAMIAMWVAVTTAVVAYIAAVDLGGVPIAHDAFLVGTLVIVALLGLPVALTTAEKDFRKTIAGADAIFVALLLMRLGYVLAPATRLDAGPWFAATVVGSLYACGCAVAALVRRSESAVAATCATWLAAGLAYVNAISDHRQDLWMITALLAAFVACGIAIHGPALKVRELWHLVVLAGWVVVSRWVYVALLTSGVDLRDISPLTVAWILYALALLGIGFVARVREMRLWSFGVMFTTMAKILLIDLSSTPIPVRVGVLLGLGLLMLGGGYWYIKGRHAPVAT